MRTISASRNRTLLFLLGALLLLAGVALGLVATGTVSWAPAPQTALGSLLEPVGEYLLPLGIAATVLATLLGLWWLAHQIPTKDRTIPYRLADDPATGTVTVEPSVLAQAVQEQLEGLPGITRARAELAGTAAHPELLIRASLSPRTEVARVLEQIYGEAVPDLEAALETRLTHVAVELDATRESAGSAKTSVRGAAAPDGREALV